MERKGNRILRGFPAATLFIDDIRDLVATFQQVCKRVELTAGECSISDLSELDELAAKFPQGRFAAVGIQGRDPYVSIDIRPYGIDAYVSDDSLEQLGLVAKARDTVRRGRKVRPIVIAGVAATTAQVLSWVAGYAHQYLLGIALILLGMLLWGLGGWWAWRDTAIVYTGVRGSKPGFLERNRDSIAVAVIAAFLGGLVTYLLTLLHR